MQQKIARLKVEAQILGKFGLLYEVFPILSTVLRSHCVYILCC